MPNTHEKLGTPSTKKRKARKSDELDPRSPDADSIIASKKRNSQPVVARNDNQKKYLRSVQSDSPITAGLGAAGTGKTYMAVAAACEAFQSCTVERIIIARPAVEAGEKLGFLPGDLKDKLDPYLQPVYDALHEFLGPRVTEDLIENGEIQIVPFAYMRGRTLKRAFVIMDEAQNSTEDQMRMFLTRIGEGSKYVICGDNSQTDLDRSRGEVTGIDYFIEIAPYLGDDCEVVTFTAKDVVRHRIVQKVLEADEQLKAKRAENQK